VPDDGTLKREAELRDRTLGRELPPSRSLIGGLYVATLKLLQALGFYDARNDRYESVIRDLLGLPLRRGSLVLDIGCGPGAITARLQDGHRILGLDADRYYLSRFVAPIPRIQARAEHLPVKDGRISAIIAISLVEHIADQAALFQELARVLRRGGRAVVQIPELRFPFEPHTKWPLLLVWNPSLRSRILASTGNQDLNLATSVGGIADLAVASGFRVERTVPIWHLRAARILGLPMGYFVGLTKG
jgi:SAM-dependent methyltransferase